MNPMTLADWRAGRMRGWNFYSAASAGYPAADDFDALAATGANHARVWIAATLADEAYSVPEAQLSQMDRCLGDLAARGLSAVVVLSIAADDQPWGSAKRSMSLAMLWYTLAARWVAHRHIAFDLLNEPTPAAYAGSNGFSADQFATIAREWPALAAQCIRMLSVADPQRIVVYEVGLGADPSQFDAPPLGIENVVYSVHVYHPHSVTHQGTGEWNAGQQNWPAVPYDDAARATLHASLYKIEAAYPGEAKYVGEFGCVNWTPGSGHARYLRDVADACVAAGLNFAAHAWREWPGWDYEAVPDGRNVDAMLRPAQRDASTPAMRVLIAAMRGEPLPELETIADPIKVPDPLPAVPAPPAPAPVPALIPVAEPAPAPGPAVIPPAPPSPASADTRALIQAYRDIAANSELAADARIQALDEAAQARHTELLDRQQAQAQHQLEQMFAGLTTTGQHAAAFERRDVAAGILAALAPYGWGVEEQMRRVNMALAVLDACAPRPT